MQTMVCSCDGETASVTDLRSNRRAVADPFYKEDKLDEPEEERQARLNHRRFKPPGSQYELKLVDMEIW